MSGENELHDTIRTIVKRTAVLETIADGPTSKRDLRDELGVSRSTVYKAVRELESHELAEQTDGGVRLTLLGRLLVEEYQSFVGTAEAVSHQHQVLSVLPPDAPVTTDLLVGAEVVLAERHAPSKPLDYVEDLTRSADALVGLAPSMFRRYNELFYDQLTSGALTAEIVIYRPVVEHLREDFGDRFAESLAIDCYTVWETTESLPFGLVVTEGDHEEVAVVAYDEGRPVGVVANDTEAALDWGRDVFECYRESARRVEAVEF